MEKGRFFIQLSYDGTRYHGWQFQPNAITVQELLEKALFTLTGEEIKVMGCGRTDTGVHAQDFYAHCELTILDLNTDKICYQLNHLLPPDIAIKKILPVGQDAHARFDAVSREYRYYIHRNKSPFVGQYSHYFSRSIAVNKMRKAGQALKVYKDFTSFSKLHTDVKTNLCEVSQFLINELPEDRIEIVIVANRFLRNMVRSVVGTLLDVGVGKTSLDDFHEIIKSKNRSNAGASAPAKGLFLHEVKYPLNYFQQKDNG